MILTTIPKQPPLSLVVILFVAIAILVCAVVVLVLRERRHKQADVCGDQRPQLVPYPSSWSRPVECVLPYGHRSRWHQGDDGSKWTEHHGDGIPEQRRPSA